MTRTIASSRVSSDERTRPSNCRLAPQQLGGWHLVRLAAEGGLSRVYQACPADGSHARPALYALKVLRRRWLDVPQAVACLRREALVGRSVAHSHLISVLASRVTVPPLFVVMPWLAGSTLAEQFACGRRPSLPEALWIARQIAEALDALHQAGWIHTDVKPGNVMVSPERHATLLDLGFARREVELRTASQRPVFGTIHYMAPELLTSAYAADIRSDIYSLGAVLYEMLTGRPPFDHPEMASVVREHRQGRPIQPRRHNPLLPCEVSELVRQMLAKEPLRRPQSPRELIARLVELEIATLSQR